MARRRSGSGGFVRELLAIAVSLVVLWAFMTYVLPVLVGNFIGNVTDRISPTASPGSSVIYSQAQADECTVARDAMNAARFGGMALAPSVGDVKHNRERAVEYIEEVLDATDDVTPPSAANAEWDAAIAALTAARPEFDRPMTKDEYTTAIVALAAAPAEFDETCKEVIRWVEDNLPH